MAPILYVVVFVATRRLHKQTTYCGASARPVLDNGLASWKVTKDDSNPVSRSNLSTRKFEVV